jgi:Cu+-exporting ATPase
MIITLDNTTNLRPESKAVVTYIKEKMKKDVYILSGDHKKTVERVGNFLGIDNDKVIGEVDAQSKMTLLK